MLGYPGSGKTTAAKLIAESIPARHIWADFERRKEKDQPSYSQTENDQLYERLNKQSTDLLQSGQSVVYDTAFNHQKDRDKLRLIATKLGIDTVVVWVKAPIGLAKKRAQNISDNSGNRVLGQQMSDIRFAELSSKLQHPKDHESVIELDGQQITKSYVRSMLQQHKII